MTKGTDCYIKEHHDCFEDNAERAVVVCFYGIRLLTQCSAIGYAHTAVSLSLASNWGFNSGRVACGQMSHPAIGGQSDAEYSPYFGMGGYNSTL